jgi:hypothetical protein
MLPMACVNNSLHSGPDGAALDSDIQPVVHVMLSSGSRICRTRIRSATTSSASYYASIGSSPPQISRSLGSGLLAA